MKKIYKILDFYFKLFYNTGGGHMKKFFKDFKAFISRGNILDMAVGVIVGNAFSAIVKAFTDKIIMPLINLLLSLGGTGLDSAYTFLKIVWEDEANGIIDLTKSIYIDWGAFITAVLNFLIIALTLFIILKVAMKSSELFRGAAARARKGRLTKEEKKELTEKGINYKDKEAVKAYREEKAAEEAEAKAEEEKKTAEEALIKEQNSTEYLLKEIRDLLKENAELRAKANESVEETESSTKKTKSKK